MTLSIAFTKASYSGNFVQYSLRLCISLTWVNFPSSRLMLRRTTLIRLPWSWRGMTMNDACSSTMSPSWKTWGFVSLKLSSSSNATLGCQVDSPHASGIILIHLEVVVNLVLFCMNVCCACGSAEVALRIHIISDRTFVVLVSTWPDGKVWVRHVNCGTSIIFLRSAAFVLELGANSPFEDSAYSG